MPEASASRTVSTRGDAAIAGDDQPGADRPGEGEAGGTEVIAVAQPVGDEGVDVGARLPERAGEQRGGRLAVHVVVAVHQDGLAPGDGPGDRSDRVGRARRGTLGSTSWSSEGRRKLRAASAPV